MTLAEQELILTDKIVEVRKHVTKEQFVVIDLLNINYVGSRLLAAIIIISDKCKAVILKNLSGNMLKVLRIAVGKYINNFVYEVDAVAKFLEQIKETDKNVIKIF